MREETTPSNREPTGVLYAGRMARLLVVDDTASIRFLMRTNLELSGHEVLEAADGRECLDLLADEAVDLVLIDAVMPNLDGYATVSAIRADERIRGLPIIMVTTQSQAYDVRRGWDAGIDEYVTKPFDPDDLVDTVSRVLYRSRG